MPRGGPRPNSGGRREGAGRPRKHPLPGVAQQPEAQAKPANPSTSTPAADDLTPLAYFLAVMNDPREPAKRRDWAAAQAAPYLHRRSAEDMPGKRAQSQAEAEEAARGKFAPRPPPRLVVSNG